MERLIEIKKLTKIYPGVRALDNVSFTINKGEVHALVGENGAGKSTLIKILAGVITPDEGEILIDGKVESFSHPLEALQKGIAVTFQDLSLFPNLSVAENISISKKIEEGEMVLDWSEMKRIAREAINELGVKLDINKKLGYLSIGNQQLVAIARALVHDAKLLILDEPTASLAKEDINALFRVVNLLKKRGMSILFVSHKLDEIFEISDRISVLRDGKYIGTYPKEEITEDELISYMVGRKVRYTRYDKRKRQEPLLEVKNLSKKNNFKDISFTLNRGEILGITGLVGAGRTEVAQAIFGNNVPDSGEIYLEGKRINNDSTSKALKTGIAYVPESRQTQGLVLGKSLADNITVTILDRITNGLNLLDKRLKTGIVREWINKLNIKPAYPDMQIDQFSGGNQQKAVIAKWLAYNPKVLIVDEPTQGIDIGAKSEIHKLLRDLAEEGMGIIVISSELPEVLAICDRILVMRRGRIAGEFTGNDVTQEELLNKAITKAG